MDTAKEAKPLCKMLEAGIPALIKSCNGGNENDCKALANARAIKAALKCDTYFGDGGGFEIEPHGGDFPWIGGGLPQ